MAKYLLCLLCLLVSNSSFAGQCTVTNGKYSATCLACQAGVGSPEFQQQYCLAVTSPVTVIPEPPKCVPITLSELRSCPVDYSGVETWKKEETCTTSGTSRSAGWIKVSDSCVKIVMPPPPVVVTPAQAAVKMITSPVTPIPIVPTTPAPVPVTPTVQAPVETPQASTTPAPAVTPAPVITKGSIAKALEITQKLMAIGAVPKQPSIIELISLNQELPDGIRRQQNLFLELIQPDDSWLDRDFPASYRWGGILWD